MPYPLRAEVSLLHVFFLGFTKSFAWLVCREIGLFTPREKRSMFSVSHGA